MPAGRKYEIPDDDLRKASLMGISHSEIALQYGCAESTIRSRIKNLDKTIQTPCEIPRGKGGDVVFDAKMGERRFTECPRAKRDYGSPERVQAIAVQYGSYTGCAASLACV